MRYVRVVHWMCSGRANINLWRAKWPDSHFYAFRVIFSRTMNHAHSHSHTHKTKRESWIFFRQIEKILCGNSCGPNVDAATTTTKNDTKGANKYKTIFAWCGRFLLGLWLKCIPERAAVTSENWTEVDLR